MVLTILECRILEGTIVPASKCGPEKSLHRELLTLKQLPQKVPAVV